MVSTKSSTKKNIAIIPARSGSKRIPQKNIKEFLGKPIIAYSIEAALNAGIFDEVMVSTNCAEIASVAKEHGAQVPFLRSHETAGDDSIIVDVLVEVVNTYASIGKEFDFVCCIFATAPLLESASLKESLQLLENTGADSIIPVIKFDLPIQRAFKISEQDKLEWFFPEFQLTRTQDLESSFHDSGQFYWVKTDILVNSHAIYTDNTRAFLLDTQTAQDIDTEADWKKAESKFHSRIIK